MSLRQRDLFEDSSMNFGDHLDELRICLIRSLIGLVIVSAFTLSFGDKMVAIVRGPIDKALVRHGLSDHKIDDLGTETFFERFSNWWNEPDDQEKQEVEELTAKLEGQKVQLEIPVDEFLAALHKADSKRFPEPAKKPEPKEGAEKEEKPETIRLTLGAPEFSIFRDVVKKINRPVTLNVQEAFMTYLKVAIVSALIISSPWIFYNVWLFVAVGLYAHERKYVYVYGTLSLFLFLSGVVFCFYLVLPFVLEFLLSFNAWLDVQPQIRLSEWVTFAVFLPLMFGISFQLPMVMVFLNRLNIFTETVYREQRRIAILVIAALSMLLTPSDPSSMLLMMFPLIFLYEFGIWLCKINPVSNPFGDDTEPEPED
ncbi:MAG: twin-arginine translocase subunit TatC [Planctomycetaceae bacterium]|nr:twin-arginine translocase subunit TatC [Planctomycetaceae bacterium]